MSEALAMELIDAYNNTGSVVKKREETHKMAQANRAFAPPLVVSPRDFSNDSRRTIFFR